MPTIRNVAIGSVLFAAALIPLACGDGGSTGPEESVPVAIAWLDAPPSSAVVGSTVPAVVRVTAASGEAVSGAVVHWTVPAGGGSVAVAATETDASGRASVEWTLGTAATENRIEAAVDGVDPLTHTVLARADRPAAITLSSDTVRFEEVADTSRLTAVVQDGYGNEIEDPTLEWSVADTAVAVVDGDGLVVSRGAGETTVTAASDTATARAVVLVTEDGATAVVADPGDITLTALGDRVPLTATATDEAGEEVVDAAVSWSTTDPAVATVTANGEVEAVGDGTAAIIVRADAAADTVSVAVHTTRGAHRSWSGSGGTTWANPLNWLPAGRPNAGDTTVVTASAGAMPVLDAAAEAWRVEVGDGATFSLDAFDLTAHADVVADGAITGAGTLTMDGTAGLLEGAVPRLLFTGTTSLSGPTTARGGVTVRGGTLTVPGQTLTIQERP